MKPERIVAVVLGSLLALPAFALFFSGGLLALAYVSQRDDGYFDVTLDEVVSSTAAVTAEEIDLRAEPGTPRWVLDALETDVRLRVTSSNEQPVFVGIAREADLDAYLAGVAHDEIDRVDGLQAAYRSRSGVDTVSPPEQESFWEASTAGSGTQVLEWEATPGFWAVAVMNADGSPGVAADVNIGIRSSAFLPVAFVLLGIGAVLSAIAAALIIFGGSGPRTTRQPPTAADPGAQPVAPGPPLSGAPTDAAAYPLTITARLDPELSNWRWLVKWILAIPHMIILFFLWIGFSVLTVVAGVAILFTGRYPRALFDFNVGVLRWSWRVSYYAFSGGLGTDHYPPFSLDRDPDYPADLAVDYPEELSRWLVLVKWWLLALPHYVIVAVIAGAGFRWEFGDDWGSGWSAGGGGLVGILTLVAAIILLFRGSYPRQLFDLIIGMNRWVYRVTAYAALMTDVYPPFRLDQGGAEPGAEVDTPPDGPTDDMVDLSDRVPGSTPAAKQSPDQSPDQNPAASASTST